MRNLHHPNWSGKSHRSREEAFGGAYYSKESLPREDTDNHWSWWLIGLVLLAALVVLAFAPLDARAQVVNYVERSLNKTIVVEKNRTYSIPNANGGVRVVTKEKRPDEWKNRELLRRPTRKEEPKSARAQRFESTEHEILLGGA